MRKPKFDKKTEKALIKLLDGASKKFGLNEVRHAANKWCDGQRAKASLAKARAELEKKLAEVNSKLST
jgi:hypothetical protein